MMSLDLEINDEYYNYTYNLAPVWYTIYPEDKGMIYIEGLTGRQASYKLIYALHHILLDYSNMKKLNPSNGWGEVSSFAEFILKLIVASNRNSRHKWRACR